MNATRNILECKWKYLCTVQSCFTVRTLYEYTTPQKSSTKLRNALMQRVKQRSHVQTVVLYLDRCAAFQSASVCADRAGSPGCPDCSESAASGPRRRRSPDAGSCCCAPAAPPPHLPHAPAQLGQSTTGVKHAIYSKNFDEYAAKHQNLSHYR